MTFNYLQASFTGGAVSRRLQSRSDTQIYGIAAAEISNMVPAVEGPLMKRPGTRIRATALATTSWLSAFVFNSTQSYVLAWSDGKVRFFTNDGPLLNAGTPVETVVPYSAAEAAELGMEDNYDALYLAHEKYPPATLLRTSATAFTYGTLALTVEPFDDANRDEAVTVTASAATGTITLTASAPVFLPGHAGAQFRIEAQDFADVQAWQAGIDGITVGSKRRSLGKVYLAETAGRTGQIQPEHVEGAEWDGSAGQDVNSKGPYGVRWAYLHDRIGIVRITAVTDSQTATATVVRRLPESVVASGSWRWAHSLFSAEAGWPHLVFIYRGRLMFFRGNKLAASVLADLRDFNEYNEEGVRSADMGFVRTIDAPDKPLWAVVDRNVLIVGTSRGEFTVDAQNDSEILSGGNIDIKPNSRHGGELVPPLQTATETLFVQRGGRKLRAAAYTIESDRYSARNLMLYARQFGYPGIKQLAYQAEPQELIWALRGNGTVAAHPYSPEQEVKGWSLGLAIEDARVLSIASIPSPDGGRDDLWLLVERGGVRTVEQLAPWWDEDEGAAPATAYFLDSGVTYSGAPTTVISGLGHLAGLTVGVLADGFWQPERVVSDSGTVTLDAAASLVHVGRLYTARLETLPPVVPRRDGSGVGVRKRLVRLAAWLIDSFNVFGAAKGAPFDQLVVRNPNNPMNSAPTMFNGSRDIAVRGDYEEQGQAVLEDRSPWPWILPALISRIEEGQQ